MGLTEKLETLPTRPGVYLLKDRDGNVLYVGKARVLRDRVRSYFQAGRPVDPTRGDLVSMVADLDLVVTDTEIEALALENNFIKRHRPRFNVLLRDDKNHPYLKLTVGEEYPRLHTCGGWERTRRLRRAYIPASWAAHLGLIHKVFGIRSCKETERAAGAAVPPHDRPVLAPCVVEVCAPGRYRQAVDDARLFLEGRTDEVVKRLKIQMEAAASVDRFEEAASLRDQIRTLQRLETPQKITTTDIDERDLFGAHAEGERAALQVFSVREGKVVGREGYLLDKVAEPERLLPPRCSSSTPRRGTCTREVLVPQEIPDHERWERGCRAARHPGRIRIPSAGRGTAARAA